VDGANIADCPVIACHEIVGQNVRRQRLFSAPTGQ
jgi:hypothetical protein